MSGERRTRSSPDLSTAIASSPWIVVSIGLIVMVALLVVALGSARDRRPYADGQPDPPAATVPLPDLPPITPVPTATAEGAVVPGLSPRSTVLPRSGHPTPRPSGRLSAGGGGGVRTPPPSPRPRVNGRYGVVTTFDGGFTGEVLIVNADSTARSWTVRLSFPQGQLADVWVAGAEQGSASVSDGVLTYRSGVDLGAGASVPLRFRVEPAATTRPDICTVNGARCAGV